MKSLGVMQPYLFPYLGYFQLLNAVDEYIIYDDVQFIKRGWINRNNILINGQKSLFTIRISKASTANKINEQFILDDFEKFLRTIEQAYARAPYKDEVLHTVKSICSYPDKNLAHFTTNSLHVLAKYLGIKTPFILSSEIQKNNNLKAQEKIITICKERNANRYINAIGGQELYDKDTFIDKGLELKFLKPHLREYKQFKNEFVPALSIIDIMMFNPVETIQEMLGEYELI